MKSVWAIVGAIVVVLLIAVGIYMVDVDQTQETVLPEVSVEGGQMPEFDATVGSVETGTETVEVEVPTIEVNPPEDAEGEPVLGDAAEDAADATEEAADATAEAADEAADEVTEQQ
ncbi:hypothetical protein [Marivivens aquimaris]|uniref:hypothetical protein n=1 Tax=Marivivens aquimaris TaxID=2774876 RepID=UPI0018815386|nr:hypothetical protein [Marivivens aquimaris]